MSIQAAIYVRVSSKAQGADDKVSLPTQIESCKSYSLLHDMVVDDGHVYVEKHTGEEWRERPELQRMLQAAARGEFQALIIHSEDRLARVARQLQSIIDALAYEGVTSHFVMEGADNETKEGQLLTYVRGWAAEQEMVAKKDRLMRTIKAKAQSGKVLASNRPRYGYAFGPERDLKSGKLLKVRYVEDPQTAPIVRRVFQQAAEGITIREIARRLSDDGIPTPNTYAGLKNGAKAWDTAVVHAMLEYSGYWGEAYAMVTVNQSIRPHAVKPGGDRYKHRVTRANRPIAEQIALSSYTVPPLVSKEIAYQVRERLHLNRQTARRNYKNPVQTLLHSGIARCAYCGWSLSLSLRHKKRTDGSSAAVYRCNKTSKVGRSCKTFIVMADKLDECIWQTVRVLLTDKDVVRHELEKLAAESPNRAKDELTRLDARIRELGREIENLAEAIGHADDADVRLALTQRLSLLTTQKRDVEKEYADAQRFYTAQNFQADALKQVEGWIGQVGRNIDRLTLEQKRMVLLALGAKVTVWAPGDRDPRVKLELRLPLSGVISDETQTEGNAEFSISLLLCEKQGILQVKRRRWWTPPSPLEANEEGADYAVEPDH